MTYSEPTPEQETAGQDAAEQETAAQDVAEQQNAAEQSEEPGKNQGDPLFAETEDEQPDAGAGTATSAEA